MGTLFIDTDHGYISEHFIFRLEKQEEGDWVVYYQKGSEYSGATATAAAAKEFFEKQVRVR